MVMMEAVCSSAALLCIYRTRWHNMPQYSELVVTSMRTSSLTLLNMSPQFSSLLVSIICVGTSTQLKVMDLQSQSMLSLKEVYILDHDNFVEANPL